MKIFSGTDGRKVSFQRKNVLKKFFAPEKERTKKIISKNKMLKNIWIKFFKFLAWKLRKDYTNSRKNF